MLTHVLHLQTVVNVSGDAIVAASIAHKVSLDGDDLPEALAKSSDATPPEKRYSGSEEVEEEEEGITA